MEIRSSISVSILYGAVTINMLVGQSTSVDSSHVNKFQSSYLSYFKIRINRLQLRKLLISNRV